MAVAYPPNLRSCIRAAKSRNQPASFALGRPRQGYGWSEPTGRDTPVAWDVMFRFTTAEAIIFRTWFVGDIANGVDEFELLIRTEFGLLTHTCKFMPEGLLDAQENGDVWEYTATIMARALLQA